MKKTQEKDAVRNIRKRIVSYLSICLVIMLGLGGLFITRYMGAGIKAKATEYYNDHSFKNYELISSVGAYDEDIAQIKSTEGVVDAEGIIRSNASLTKGDLNCAVDLISMTERISVPEVVEGRAPEAKDECMIGEDLAEVKGLKVGDRVKIALADSSLDMDSSDPDQRTLYETEFTITGLMKHPDYFRRKSTDNVVLPWAAFNKDYLDGLHTHVLVRTEEPKGADIFSEKYFKDTADTKQRLEDLTDVLGVEALARAKQRAYDALDSRWQEALDELEEGQNEIDENEAKLNAELADARADLNAAQNKLNKKIKAAQKEINKAKKAIKLADEKLPEAKKYIEDMRAAYGEDIRQSLEDLAKAQKWLDIINKFDPGTEEYKEAVEDLAYFIVEKQEAIRKVHEFCKRDDVKEIAQKLKELTGIDATGVIGAIGSFDVEGMIDMATGISEGGGIGDIENFITETKEWIDYQRDYLKQLDEWEGYIKKYEENRASYVKLINQKEKEIKAEKKKYQAQINAGWNLYFSQKAEYEQKLEEAKALLKENREEAEKKFAELRAEVEEMECTWLVLDRRANAGYVDVRSNISAINTASMLFGILFMLISAIVCFSTLTIIIDEQKKMVGTVKAFGFLKKEILGKYLMFGVTAAIIGCIAGILAAVGLSGLVIKAFVNAGMYQFDTPSTVVTPGMTVLACALMILVCALATIIACSDILKSPASILMKGGTSKKGAGYRKESKNSSKRGGSLYSRLIVRNMLDDKARVAISIIIIAFSTLLIGVGISMKIAFDGMTEKQISDIYNYDVRVEFSDELNDEDRAAVEETLDSEGAEYALASYKSHIFRLDDRLDALYVLAGDPEEISGFYRVTDPKTGEAVALPDDGVLAQRKIKESYGYGEGSTLSVFSDDLKDCGAEVRGVFQNYVGRLIITSPEGYRSIFGEDPEYNCYYVRLGDTGIDKLENDILALRDDASFEVASEFVKKFDAVSMLYNLIVIVTTGIAILMSAMILSNLANIFLNRKKTELTVMRINGFSIKQTKGYLSKETILTSAIGIAIGVLVGAIAAPLIIKAMEPPDVQFVRTFHVTAWVIAVAIEGIFSLVIHSLVFRKVKDLNFRDVA